MNTSERPPSCHDPRIVGQPAPPWQQGAALPFLADGELHIWQASLDRSEDELAGLARLLSADEHARARRFHFQRDRRRFIAGRGLLRSILGRYLDRAPAQLAFLYSSQGKPSLAETAWQFNLAHSDDLAVIALARSRAVGIDLERVRPVQDWERIMNSFFAVAEVQTILGLPPAARLRAFFTCWTRKEAYLKATGDGLAVRLDRFSVPAEPGSQPRLLQVEGAPQEATRWSFHELPVGADFLGVVAVEGAVRAIQHYLWPSA